MAEEIEEVEEQVRKTVLDYIDKAVKLGKKKEKLGPKQPH